MRAIDMEDKYEKLVRWYLRFNGYLTVENYVVHEARNGRVPRRIASATAHIVAETRFPGSYCASFRDSRIEAAISRTRLRPSSTVAFSPWWYSEPSY